MLYLPTTYSRAPLGTALDGHFTPPALVEFRATGGAVAFGQSSRRHPPTAYRGESHGACYFFPAELNWTASSVQASGSTPTRNPVGQRTPRIASGKGP